MLVLRSSDLLSLLLYFIIMLAAVVLLLRRTNYLRERYSAGAVSLFMIAAFLFLTGLSGFMGSAIWARIIAIFELGEGLSYTLQRFFLLASSMLTAAGIWLIVLIDHENWYSVFLKIRKDNKGDAEDGKNSTSINE